MSIDLSFNRLLPGMEITNQSSRWLQVSDEVRSKTYGPDGEYGLEDLYEDVQQEFNSVVGSPEAASTVYEELERRALENGRVTGEDISDMKTVRNLLGN